MLRKVSAFLLTMAVLAGGGYEIWSFKARTELETIVQKYLTALKKADYEEAYSMLSEEAKKYISQDEFIKLQNGREKWSFREFRVIAKDGDIALVNYEIKVGTEPWDSNNQGFWIKHNDQWLRAYSATLWTKIKEAKEKNDSTEEILLAQQLMDVVAEDPLAYKFLCDAYKNQKKYSEAQKYCVLSDQYNKKFPGYLSAVEVAEIFDSWSRILLALEKCDEAEVIVNRGMDAASHVAEDPSWRAYFLKRRCDIAFCRAVKINGNLNALVDKWKLVTHQGSLEESLSLLRRMKEENQKIIEELVVGENDLDEAAQICSRSDAGCDDTLIRSIHDDLNVAKKLIANGKRASEIYEIKSKQLALAGSEASETDSPNVPELRLPGYKLVSAEDLIADRSAYYGQKISVVGAVTHYGVNVATLESFLLEGEGGRIQVTSQNLPISARKKLLRVESGADSGGRLIVGGVWDGQNLEGMAIKFE